MQVEEIAERVWRSVVPRGSDYTPLLLPIEWERQIEAVMPGLDRQATDVVLDRIEAKIARNVLDIEGED